MKIGITGAAGFIGSNLQMPSWQRAIMSSDSTIYRWAAGATSRTSSIAAGSSSIKWMSVNWTRCERCFGRRTALSICHVIVVDDGSTDGTENILEGFKDLPLTVVRHSPNRGVAKAF